jgi:hypothetical protein
MTHAARERFSKGTRESKNRAPFESQHKEKQKT